MSDIKEVQEQQTLARRIARSLPLEQQERFRVWVAKLVEIRGSGSSTFVKAKHAVSATVSDGVAVGLAQLVLSELKRLGWAERGLKWRVGFVTAVIAAVVTGGQGAGIAALGGAIGVPLWLVVGAGGAFLAMLYEELGAGPNTPMSPPSVAPTAEATAVSPTPAPSPDIIDVVAKKVPSAPPAEARVMPASEPGVATAPVEPHGTAPASASGLWVGDLNGTWLIYDPAIQVQDGPHVFLWNSGTHEMEKYVPGILRKHIRPYRGAKPLDDLQRLYSEWLRHQGKQWLVAEVRQYQEQRFRASTEKTRATHCYRCKDPLEGNVDPPCAKCEWLACSSCGACGCGYAA